MLNKEICRKCWDRFNNTCSENYIKYGEVCDKYWEVDKTLCMHTTSYLISTKEIPTNCPYRTEHLVSNEGEINAE